VKSGCIAVLLAFFACRPSQQTAARAPADGGEAPDSKALLAEVDRLKDQLNDRPKSFEVLSALGNLYYENGRYLEAIDAYREAEALAAPAEARSLALKKLVKPAADLPAECRRSGPDYGLSKIAEAASKLDEPRELRCLDAALDMELQIASRRGNAFYLIGNSDSALAEHRKVLERSPDYPESLFFVGAILLEQSHGDKKQLAEGKKYWQRLLKVAPDSPRAPIVRDTLPRADEVFTPKAQMPAGHPPVAENDLPPGHPPIGGGQPGAPMSHTGTGPAPGEPSAEEIRNLQEAVANTERTPELEKGLDALLAQSEKDLDRGRYQEARDAVVRVMPMRPDDPRTAAAMGGAMRGLGRVQMAERTLSRALQLDPKQPRALYEMGKLLAQQGDKAGALQRFNALKSSDPKFAQSHRVDEELAKLK
jgi:tetratricopeptide (TPR) repeat protein